MLNKAKVLEGYRLDSLNGKIGKVKDFYFDDRSWSIRYLVADTGFWLTCREVLISPNDLGTVIKREQHISISLTKKQIENSSSLNSDAPPQRQFEEDYGGYNGWPAYQGGESWDPHLCSIQDVTGYCLQTADGQIGDIDDFIIDDDTWEIRYLIINIQDLWPGKKVLVLPQWIDHISWRESKVFVNIPRETINLSSKYTEESLLASKEYFQSVFY